MSEKKMVRIMNVIELNLNYFKVFKKKSLMKKRKKEASLDTISEEFVVRGN